MKTYFNIQLEFDKEIVHKQIFETINDCRPRYVCVVDGNVLATATKDESYRKILNKSLVNICDGSSIALIASRIHKKKFSTYTGPQIFNYLIQENRKQYFLGNTKEVHEKLYALFEAQGLSMANFHFQQLPFCSVEDFDYLEIAKNINNFCPDFIWVSLGAPKQERFIARLIPNINRGIAFAIGAAFNFYINDEDHSRAPLIIRRLHLEWLFRVYKEPKRIGTRAWSYLKILPRITRDEIKAKRFNK